MNGSVPVRYLALGFAMLLATSLTCLCEDETTAPDENAANCSGTTGTYVLTPTAPAPPPAPYSVTDDYFYHSTDADGGGGPNCDLVNYEDCPDEAENYFQYNSGAGCGGSNVFTARLGSGSAAYDFYGNYVRSYNTGTGPFATGSYDRPNGESGTFEFYEAGRTP